MTLHMLVPHFLAGFVALDFYNDIANVDATIDGRICGTLL